MSRAGARAACSFAVLALTACSAAPPLPEFNATHPASPQADEAPERAPSTVLSMPKREPQPPADAPSQSPRGH